MTQPFKPGIVAPTSSNGSSTWAIFRGRDILTFADQQNNLLPQFSEREIATINIRERHYLGTLGETHCYGSHVTAEEEAPPGYIFVNMRQLLGVFSDVEFQIAGRGLQIAEWDRNHQYCGRCGGKMIVNGSERAKECTQCSYSNFPRISPAVIVQVTRGNELLLGRSAHFRPGMYSVLAGFVDPGESLEETVHREIYEEVRLRVKNVRYFGSQSWPFPHSLMVGFTAEYESGEIDYEQDELEDAGWFTAETMPVRPSPRSIAGRLIDDFVKKFG